MGLTAYKEYQDLLSNGHFSQKIGFKGKGRDINEFSNRVRLARSFSGLILEGYTPRTVAGYDGFMQIFLTHSTFERFLKIFGINIDNVGNVFPDSAGEIIEVLCEIDSDRKLFDFIHPRLNNKLQKKLMEIYNGEETNVAYIGFNPAYIRSRNLTATANRINPIKVKKLCDNLSVFLLDFMDSEFSKKINEYQKKITDGVA
jgi:hypothetical protein